MSPVLICLTVSLKYLIIKVIFLNCTYFHNCILEFRLLKKDIISVLSRRGGVDMLPHIAAWLLVSSSRWIPSIYPQFAMIETVLTGVLDQFPQLRPRKTLVILSICIILFLLGLPLSAPVISTYINTKMFVCLSVCLSVHVFLGHFETDWETLWHTLAYCSWECSKTIFLNASFKELLPFFYIPLRFLCKFEERL